MEKINKITEGMLLVGALCFAAAYGLSYYGNLPGSDISRKELYKLVQECNEDGKYECVVDYNIRPQEE